MSTPELYPSVTKIARILGPKMLMPMVKRGTVTDDIADTIRRMDDKLDFNSDKFGWIHTGKLTLWLKILNLYIFTFVLNFS